MLVPQENYQLARQLAVEKLRTTDVQERALRCGGRWQSGPGGGSAISLRCLGREIVLSFPEGRIEEADGHGPVPLREEILLLHYVEKGTGSPLASRWISFAEIPGGAFYHPVFRTRCQAPLVRTFGQNVEGLKEAAAEFAGAPLGMGDAGVIIPALPCVPLGLVLWRGDEEFPADGNVLFDASVSEYLPVEDIVILAETVVWKLVKRRKNGFTTETQRTKRPT